MSHHRVAGGPRQAVGIAHAVAVAAVACVTSAGVARAQDGGSGFLFREPVAQFSVRGGYALASAGSDVFSFTTEQLTVSKQDFSSGTLAATLAFRIAPRVDFALDAAYMGRSTPSEFRQWTDTDDQPIEQETDFRRVPLSGSLRFYLASRGRSLGEFAWVPSRFAPYVGAGAGATWYRFRQNGDFVDYKTLDVYPDQLESSGWVPSAHAMVGGDLTISPHVGLTGEVRYAYGRGKMTSDFDGFDKIDLSGATATVGLFFRF